MKTLDEVIMCLEGCGHIDCDDCPYHYEDEKIEVDDCAQVYKDALHYLKKYRDNYEARNDQVERYQRAAKECEEILTDYVALKQYWAEKQANSALSWEELQQMVGKPVWVEALLYKQWAIVAYVGVDYIRFEGVSLYATECRIYMGEDNGWQAYRKEQYE